MNRIKYQSVNNFYAVRRYILCIGLVRREFM